jgi:pilus assembly protein Flp/PilA
MKNKIVEFLKDESGQTSTEYILLVAVVAFIIFKFKGVLEEKLIGTGGSGGLVGKVFENADGLLQDLNQ